MTRDYYVPTEHGLHSDLLASCAVDHDGVVWLGASKGGVTSYNGRTWKAYHESDRGLSSTFISDIVVDGQNRKWFAAGNGVSSGN